MGLRRIRGADERSSINAFKEQLALNWTATYRADSTLPAPYDKFLYSPLSSRSPQSNAGHSASESESLKALVADGLLPDYVLQRTQQVAWLASNCGTSNARLEIRESAREARGRGGVGRVRQPDVWRGSPAVSRATVTSLPLLSRVREQQLPRLHY